MSGRVPSVVLLDDYEGSPNYSSAAMAAHWRQVSRHLCSDGFLIETQEARPNEPLRREAVSWFVGAP